MAERKSKTKKIVKSTRGLGTLKIFIPNLHGENFVHLSSRRVGEWEGPCRVGDGTKLSWQRCLKRSEGLQTSSQSIHLKKSRRNLGFSRERRKANEGSKPSFEIKVLAMKKINWKQLFKEGVRPKSSKQKQSWFDSLSERKSLYSWLWSDPSNKSVGIRLWFNS